MTEEDFVQGLVGAVPEVSGLIAEHRRDQFGELLLHVLVADVRRFVLGAFERNESDLVARCLGFLDLALRSGDERVQNAVAVSFVEDTGWWDRAMVPFMAAWPEGLRAEAERQRRWKPPAG